MLLKPARGLTPAALLVAALSAGCPASVQDSVTFHPLRSEQSPYETVTIELGLDPDKQEVQSLGVHPEMAVIWFESVNPISQLLWTVRCTERVEGGKGEVSCPPDLRVVVRPKGACSKTLFGASPGAESGEILIRPGDNAIPSGRPNPDELRGLLRRKGEKAAPCAEPKPCMPEAEARMAQEPEEVMILRESVHDYQWVYEVLVYRGERELFSCDPEVWIEQDGSGG